MYHNFCCYMYTDFEINSHLVIDFCQSNSTATYVNVEYCSANLMLTRVGHLILRALATRASDPQNTHTRTSFHSPKNSPPSPHP